MVDEFPIEGKNDKDDAKTYKEHCPVCQSADINAEIEHSYHGVPHHFCSNHCRDRFQRRPHLYVGSPRFKLSVKQQGRAEPKSHSIALPEAPSATLAAGLCARIKDLPGVQGCQLAGDTIEVSYDLLVISLKDIEQVVVPMVGELKGSVADRAKRKALHFAEECQLDNLAHLSDSGKQYHY